MTLLTLKPFTFFHLAAAVRLDQQCLGGLWSLEGYRRELGNSNSLLLVLTTPAEVSDRQDTSQEDTGRESELPLAGCERLLGMICAWRVLEEVHITLLAVHPVVQRQGLGQLLLLGLLQVAHQQGLERATLEVRPSNQSALALYQKFDFREAGRRRQYYPDREDGLILWRSGLQDAAFATLLQQQEQQLHKRLQTTGWSVRSIPKTTPTATQLKNS